MKDAVNRYKIPKREVRYAISDIQHLLCTRVGYGCREQCGTCIYNADNELNEKEKEIIQSMEKPHAFFNY